MTARETGPNGFKTRFIKRIKRECPFAVVLLTDPGYLQGVPDILVLVEDYWFCFEVKAAKGSRRQPNQTWWVDKLDDMSFARFVYPENEEEVILGFQRALESRGIARFS